MRVVPPGTATYTAPDGSTAIPVAPGAKLVKVDVVPDGVNSITFDPSTTKRSPPASTAMAEGVLKPVRSVSVWPSRPSVPPRLPSFTTRPFDGSAIKRCPEPSTASLRFAPMPVLSVIWPAAFRPLDPTGTSIAFPLSAMKTSPAPSTATPVGAVKLLPTVAVAAAAPDPLRYISTAPNPESATYILPAASTATWLGFLRPADRKSVV